MTTIEALTARLTRLRAHCALAGLRIGKDIDAANVHVAGEQPAHYAPSQDERQR